MIADRHRRHGVVHNVCDVASPRPGSSVQGPDRARTATDRGLEGGRHFVAAGPGHAAGPLAACPGLDNQT